MLQGATWRSDKSQLCKLHFSRGPSATRATKSHNLRLFALVLPFKPNYLGNMASCTSPALVDTRQVKIPDFSSICLDSGKKKQVHTPSTVCPTPRTPVSPALLPPLALDLHEQTSSSEDVQPFWWPMSEGDEGVLSSPFDEPQEGKQVVNLSGLPAIEGAFVQTRARSKCSHAG